MILAMIIIISVGVYYHFNYLKGYFIGNIYLPCLLAMLFSQLKIYDLKEFYVEKFGHE